jgi:hypothetical protein
MIFNGTYVYPSFGDKGRFPEPAMKVGDRIRFHYNDTQTKPNSRTVMIKKGVYEITWVGPGVAGWTIYNFVKVAKNAKYVHRYDQIAIDKSIKLGFASVEKV